MLLILTIYPEITLNLSIIVDYSCKFIIFLTSWMALGYQSPVMNG
jgi:hypothetical protein